MACHNWRGEGRRHTAYWQATNFTSFTAAILNGGQMEFSIKEKFEAAVQFLREVKTELKKVTWPSRKDTLSGTLVVLVAIFIIAIFLWVVDTGLSGFIKQLLKRAVS